MKISPIDIAHKEFNRKIMGYSPEEVSEFLNKISNQMEELMKERNKLKESLREKEIHLLEFEEKDDLLKNTIKTATKMAEKLQSDAQREVKLILNEAHQKSEVIVSDARDSLKRVYQEITDLKRIRMQFENNLKAIIESHLSMIEQGRKIMPSPHLNGLNFESEKAKKEEIIKFNVKKAVEKNIESSSLRTS